MSAQHPFVITNARLVTDGGVEQGSVRVEAGRIAALGDVSPAQGDATVEARGALLVPGLVDFGVFAIDKPAFHFGGITRAALMPDQSPILDLPSRVSYIAKSGKPDLWVHPLAAATRGLGGIELAELALMNEAGARGVATGRRWSADAGGMLRLLQYAAMLDLVVVSHAEDGGLAGTAVASASEMATRLGLSNVIGLAIVTVAVKAGYLASVTNPIPLTIAQPLVGLQIFSGAGVRFAFFLVFLVIGIGFVLYMIRKEGVNSIASMDINHAQLTTSHKLVLLVLMAGVAFLVYASNRWHWEHQELSGYYIALSMLIAAVGRVGPSEAADAFVSGMKKILMASMLIGVAAAVAVVLEQGKILDSIVNSLTAIIGGDSPFISAVGMFCSQLLLDFLIPSTSGQAAVSMPILGPLGQLTGVEPQTTVLTFLFGNGITNMLTPTSGTLLAYLATAQVGWLDWAKFIFRLWLIYIVVAIALLGVAVSIGY